VVSARVQAPVSALALAQGVQVPAQASAPAQAPALALAQVWVALWISSSRVQLGVVLARKSAELWLCFLGVSSLPSLALLSTAALLVMAASLRKIHRSNRFAVSSVRSHQR
jgi:hypothetical protein